MPKQKWRPDGCISLRVFSQQQTRKPPWFNSHCVSTYFRHFISKKLSGFINLNTIWRQQKNLESISGSSPSFALSNYTTFSQTQTGATVPFNMPFCRGRFKKFSSTMCITSWFNAKTQNIVRLAIYFHLYLAFYLFKLIFSPPIYLSVFPSLFIFTFPLAVSPPPPSLYVCGGGGGGR